MKKLLVLSVMFGLLISLVGRIGGLSVTAIGWVGPLAVAMTVLAMTARVRARLLMLWLPWVVFLGLSTLLTGQQGSVVRLIILVCPVVVAWSASSLQFNVRDVEWIRTATLITAAAAVAIVIAKVYVIGSFDKNRLAAESVACVALAWVLLTKFRLTRDWWSAALAAVVMCVPIIGSSRGPFIAGLAWLVLGLPMVSIVNAGIRLVVVGAISLVALLYFEPFAAKTVTAGASLADLATSSDAIQTSGRLAAWELLVDGIADQPMVGHGANASEAYLVENFSEEFAHPHNDYLRLLFDYGIAGLMLFVVTAAVQFARLVSDGRSLKNAELAVSAWCGAALFVPFALLMAVDNVIMYAAFFGNLHYLHVGIAESILRRSA